MLFGSLRMNVWFGIVGFMLTFLLSLNSNVLTTSLIRGSIAGVAWFLLAFAVRFALRLLTRSEPMMSGYFPANSGAGQKEDWGLHLDFTTPDEREILNDLLKSQPDVEPAKPVDFKPLDPPRLATNKDAEVLAKAVRHLADK